MRWSHFPTLVRRSSLPYDVYFEHIFLAAPRIEEEHSGDRFGRREDFLSSRCELWIVYFSSVFDFIHAAAERHHAPVREDIPLPTQPPYTAFVGNLAFDLTESELEQFFFGIKVC